MPALSYCEFCNPISYARGGGLPATSQLVFCFYQHQSSLWSRRCKIDLSPAHSHSLKTRPNWILESHIDLYPLHAWGSQLRKEGRDHMTSGIIVRREWRWNVIIVWQKTQNNLSSARKSGSLLGVYLRYLGIGGERDGPSIRNYWWKSILSILWWGKW